MRTYTFLALLVLLPQLSYAATLAGDPPNGAGPAYYAEPTAPGTCCWIAQGFTVSGYSSLTQASWWGAYAGAPFPRDFFLVDLYSGVLGTDAVPFLSFLTSAVRVPTALFSGGYQYTFTFPTPVDLSPGTQYFIGIQNGPAYSPWAWQTSTSTDAFWVADQTSSGVVWHQDPRHQGLSFQLSGNPVSGPGTSSAVAAALLLLAIRSRVRLRTTARSVVEGHESGRLNLSALRLIRRQ